MKIKLNLIPEYKKEDILQRRRFRLAVWHGFYLMAIFATAFAVLFSFSFSLSLELDLVTDRIGSGNQKENYEKIRKYDEEFINMNSYFSRVKKIQDEALYWSNIFLNLNKLDSSGIVFDEFVAKDLKLMIVGTAKNRETLLKFKDSLEKDACFSSISLPLSNLVEKDNVTFQMDLMINLNCLKNQ